MDEENESTISTLLAQTILNEKVNLDDNLNSKTYRMMIQRGILLNSEQPGDLVLKLQPLALLARCSRRGASQVAETYSELWRDWEQKWIQGDLMNFS